MKSSVQRAVVVIAVAAVALAAGVYLSREAATPAPVAGRGAAPATSTGPAVSPVLSLALPDPEGKEQRFDQWKGKVLVVNFWATWCAPCREEMPEFMRAQKEFGAKGLQIVGIAVDQADKVQQYVKETGLNYPTVIGGFGAMELSKTLGNELMALPFTVVIDRSGSVAHTQLGILKPDKLDGLLKSLL